MKFFKTENTPILAITALCIAAAVGCSDADSTQTLDQATSSSALVSEQDNATTLSSQVSTTSGESTSTSAETTTSPADSSEETSNATARVLIFSETKAFRHQSIDVANQALSEITNSANIRADLAGDSAGIFTESNLENYDAVVFLLTSGNVLERDEQVAFENYIRAGGGFAGIHSASDTEYDWPWYGNLIGTYFDNHPKISSATQAVEDNQHISTSHLSDPWIRTDEWYNYQSNPRAEVNVLLTLDESTYEGGSMGADHPSAWYHEFDGGRSWYTGGGHTNESYSEPDFIEHLLGGIKYAAGVDS